jgi:hypothetical protein
MIVAPGADADAVDLAGERVVRDPAAPEPRLPRTPILAEPRLEPGSRSDAPD